MCAFFFFVYVRARAHTGFALLVLNLQLGDILYLNSPSKVQCSNWNIMWYIPIIDCVCMFLPGFLLHIFKPSKTSSPLNLQIYLKHAHSPYQIS